MSGKDIRRLVAYGSVFDNMEKRNIIKRVLMALNSLRVEKVVLMPDTFGLGVRAIEDVKTLLQARILDMEMWGSQEDSIRAAQIMREMGVACIITLGGDGTNRVVAKECGNVPILPVSTGTNNVFSFMVEGTVAGLAAGVLTVCELPIERVCKQMPRLEIIQEGDLKDIALVDLVVTDHQFIGARAVWEIEAIKEVFLTRAKPSSIGFSSLGGYLQPLGDDAKEGLHIAIGPGGRDVRAPIAPGLIRTLPVRTFRRFNSQEEIPIGHKPAVLALDGERECHVSEEDKLMVRLNPKGPWVVDLDAVLSAASKKGLFVS
jgi:predicted polyphosphate/ATP-dependent NAD kinase